MKNLNSLIIVLIVLIVLSCKCQSDLFGTKKDDVDIVIPTPTNTASGTPSSTPADNNNKSSNNRNSGNSNNRNGDSGSSLLSTGTYVGKGKNVTYNQSGDFLLRIDSVDSSGKVRGYFEASNGLQGSTDLEGTISSSGHLLLDGTFDDGQSLAIDAMVSGNKITAGYGLSDPQLKIQSGNFTVVRR